MVEPKSVGIFWVRFDLIKISDGSTLTVRFADYDYSIETDGIADEVFGGVLDINGFEMTVGEPMPVRNGGNIVLDTTRGVTGKDNRITDLLYDYFWVNSKCFITSSKKSPDSSNWDSRTEFVGIIKDVDFNSQQNQLRVNVEPVPIDTKFEQVQISTTIFPNAIENIGTYLPIIFGTPTVPGYFVDATTIDMTYAYASAVTGYNNADSTLWYSTNAVNEWKPITDDNDPTPPPQITLATGNTATRILRAPDNDAATPVTSRSFRQKARIQKNYLAHRMTFILQNKSGVTQDYKVIFTAKVSQRRRSTTNENDIDNILLATGSTEYVQTQFNDDFWGIGITFDKPVLFEAGKNYFFEIAMAGNENQTADYTAAVWTGTPGANATEAKLFRKLGNAADWDRIELDIAFSSEILCFQFIETAANNTNSVKLDPNSAPQDDLMEPIPFIVKAGGLKDNVSGTITGTASSAITDPYEVTRFLLRDQLSNLDTSTFDAATVVRTNFPRNVQGFSKGRESNEELLAQILKQTACKLVPRNNGTQTTYWCLYPYGYQSSSIRYVTEQDCKLTGYKMFGRDSVVNEVQVVYEETSIKSISTTAETRLPNNYVKTKLYNNATGNPYSTWTAESFARFGTRPLNNRWTELDWIGDDQSADFYAQYILQTYARPKIIVELQFPYFESDFRTIQNMDILELSHPDMPATFGTSPDSLNPLPVFNGQLVETASYSLPWRRAQSYRLQVISRKIIFNVKSKEAPILEVTCRILWNPNEIY